MFSNRISYCSINTRENSLEPPIGSAAGFSRCVLFEIPLPWTKKALESVQISKEIKDALAEYREHIGEITALLLVPEPEYAIEGARLIDIQVTDGHLTKRELIAEDGDLAAIIRTFARNENLPESVRVDETPYRDLIVCTQGSRDACCGTFGVRLYQDMRDKVSFLPTTRVWRSSHLGGHRFAPTLIDFPTGRSWGFVDEGVVRAILDHTSQPDELVSNYRGWVGYTEKELQLLEGEVLAAIGWEWNEYSQTAKILERDEQGRGTLVELVGSHPDKPTIAFRGEIEWGEEFSTIASCYAEPVTYVRKRLVNFVQVSKEPVVTA